MNISLDTCDFSYLALKVPRSWMQSYTKVLSMHDVDPQEI